MKEFITDVSLTLSSSSTCIGISQAGGCVYQAGTTTLGEQQTKAGFNHLSG